jgi:hypothetical protein
MQAHAVGNAAGIQGARGTRLVPCGSADASASNACRLSGSGRMSRLLAIMLLSAVLAGACRPARALESPHDLARYCDTLQKATKGSGRALAVPISKGPLLCWGYMQAVQDLGELTDEAGHRLAGFCPPKESRLSDLVRAFLESGQSRRADANANTLLAVIKALQAAYPCPAPANAAKP